MFAARRQRVLDAMGPDAIAIFVGARTAIRSNDTEYPFRQDSDFWYLSGFDHPDAVAVLRTDGGPPFTLFVQPRDRDAEVWTGYRPGLEGARDDFGADDAYAIDDLHKQLPSIVERARRIYHVLGRNTELDRRLVELLDELRRRSRLGVTPADEIVDPRSIVHEMRLFKSGDEIDLLRQAASITREGHLEAARIAHEGHFEYELEAALDWSYRRRGAAGPAYASIVGGGANASILHYVRNDQPLRNGELVLIDSGAELAGYAADVTRTYPVGGHFEGARRAVYEAVLDAQQAALEAARPGATLDEIHDVTLLRLVDGMLTLGLLTGSRDENLEQGHYRSYYMHRTSHWLGLDVHDVGSYAQGSSPRKLEPGMVFTVEPGIYVSADAADAPQALRGMGVRIEDDVLVTESGIENLSAAIPKEPDAVEALVRG